MAEENSGTWTDFFQDSFGTILEVGLPAILDGDKDEPQSQQIAEQYAEKNKPIDNVSAISGGTFNISKDQMMLGAGLLLGVVVLAKVAFK